MDNSNWNKPLIITPKTTEAGPLYKAKRFSRKKIFLGFLLLIVLVFLFLFGQQFLKSFKANKNVLTSSQVLEAVNKLIVLPTEETPVIKTVTTLEELNYQPFFMNAEVGDQFVLYEKAKRAILYRPSANKIIQILAN